MTEKIPENAPETFNTHSPHLRGHFENYKEEPTFENGESEYDEVREEIAAYYGVPFTTEEDKEMDSNKENHIFIVDNKIVSKQRNHRAFCVITRKDGENQNAWYIDGRLPHVTMLQRLYNYYHVPDDDNNEINLGFLDHEGFPDIEAIQKKSRESGKPITWFLRTTTSPERGKEHLIDISGK